MCKICSDRQFSIITWLLHKSSLAKHVQQMPFWCISALVQRDYHLAAIIRFIHRKWYTTEQLLWLKAWMTPKINREIKRRSSLFSLSKQKTILFLTYFFPLTKNSIHHITAAAILSLDWQLDQLGTQIQVTEGQSSLNWNGCSAVKSFAYAARMRAAGGVTWTPVEVEDALHIRYTDTYSCSVTYGPIHDSSCTVVNVVTYLVT